MLVRFSIERAVVQSGEGQRRREKRRREEYGSWEKGGREVRFPMWLETGEIGENYAKLPNILQSEKAQRGGSQQI